jgi:hypothetical protein
MLNLLYSGIWRRIVFAISNFRCSLLSPTSMLNEEVKGSTETLAYIKQNGVTFVKVVCLIFDSSLCKTRNSASMECTERKRIDTFYRNLSCAVCDWRLVFVVNPRIFLHVLYKDWMTLHAWNLWTSRWLKAVFWRSCCTSVAETSRQVSYFMTGDRGTQVIFHLDVRRYLLDNILVPR